MSDLLLDNTGDLALDAFGSVALVTGADAVRQNWAIVIKTFLGDWFRDLNVGVDWPALFEKPSDLIRVRAALVQASKQVAGIEAIERMDVALNQTTRKMTVVGVGKMVGGELVDLVYAQPIVGAV